MNSVRKFLGVDIPKPRVAFFEFTSCEGCQLQLFNNEEQLFDFLDLIDIVNFREIMSTSSEKFDIAFVEGSVSCAEEVERLQRIRRQADTLVAFGSCACFGGVNQLRNPYGDAKLPRKLVYGEQQIPATPLPAVLPLQAVVPIDLQIYGCPVNTLEVRHIVRDMVLGKEIRSPNYPVCLECTAHGYICLYDLGEICLGPITRGGCDAWCPASRFGCQGCRGPAEVVNVEQLERTVEERHLDIETLIDRLECFGGFQQSASELRQKHGLVYHVAGEE